MRCGARSRARSREPGPHATCGEMSPRAVCTVKSGRRGPLQPENPDPKVLNWPITVFYLYVLREGEGGVGCMGQYRNPTVDILFPMFHLNHPNTIHYTTTVYLKVHVSTPTHRNKGSTPTKSNTELTA